VSDAVREREEDNDSVRSLDTVSVTEGRERDGVRVLLMDVVDVTVLESEGDAVWLSTPLPAAGVAVEKNVAERAELDTDNERVTVHEVLRVHVADGVHVLVSDTPSDSSDVTDTDRVLVIDGDLEADVSAVIEVVADAEVDTTLEGERVECNVGLPVTGRDGVLTDLVDVRDRLWESVLDRVERTDSDGVRESVEDALLESVTEDDSEIDDRGEDDAVSREEVCVKDSVVVSDLDAVEVTDNVADGDAVPVKDGVTVL
jgi:hypothetical protein